MKCRLLMISGLVLHLISMSLLNVVTVRAQASPVTFIDITNQAGIDFRYTFGDYTYGNILESSGSGVTVFDYDGDGDMDLYMLNGTFLEGISDPEGRVFKGTPNQLYRNNGDGTFTEVSMEAGVDDRHWSMAAGALDYDGDGDVDLYLLNYGPNVFYRNNGDGTFADVTDALGLRGPETLNGYTKWSVGVAFWDYNRDGAVDLMVGNFLAFDPSYISPTSPDRMPHPSEYRGQASMLYRQENDGRFIDVTKELGFYYPDSKCMGLTVFDYDDDGDLDLFQGNDHQMNFLFRNNGNGTFQEVAVASGVAVNDHGRPTGSMHGSIGDIDGDGLIDLLVTDLRYGALYRNQGSGLFEDITERSGIASAFAGKGEWAAALFDYDNDGDLDVFSANGTADELILQHPLLLENDGKGRFWNVGPERGAYFRKKRSGRGAAVWDFDNDGDLDIIISHVDLRATAKLLRNDGGNRNHWLGLTLVGGSGPASAIGAKVTILAGEHKQVRVNQWATSYLSNHDPRIHIGLGKQKQVDRLEIMWPDGHKEIYRDMDTDRYLTIVEGGGIR
ncbi:MAG: CRTAC1 family protein [bacterium]